MTAPDENSLEQRVEKLLEVVMLIAAGDLRARAEQSDRGDALDALTCGINMLAEEIAKRFEEKSQLAAQLVDAKEQTIAAQEATIRELSTPVIQIWDDILVLPLVSTLDSGRAKQMVELLLHEVAARQTRVAIIDITGVPVVDSFVARHLIKTVQGAVMLGTECILTGINPHIAQTLVQSGVDMGGILTKGSLQSGLAAAFTMTGKVVQTSAQHNGKNHATRAPGNPDRREP